MRINTRDTTLKKIIFESIFESFEHFKQEVFDYMIYYNQMRPHQALNGQNPQTFANNCQRIT